VRSGQGRAGQSQVKVKLGQVRSGVLRSGQLVPWSVKHQVKVKIMRGQEGSSHVKFGVRSSQVRLGQDKVRTSQPAKVTIWPKLVRTDKFRSKSSKFMLGQIRSSHIMIRSRSGQVWSSQVKVKLDQVSSKLGQGQVRSDNCQDKVIRSDQGLVELRRFQLKVRSISSSGRIKVELCHVK